MTEPRNFSGNYPLGGEKIGPLWRAMWASLQEKRWTASPSLADIAESQGLARSTAIGLLSRARKCGQLEVSYRLYRSRRTAFYRIIS